MPSPPIVPNHQIETIRRFYCLYARRIVALDGQWRSGFSAAEALKLSLREVFTLEQV